MSQMCPGKRHGLWGKAYMHSFLYKLILKLSFFLFLIVGYIISYKKCFSYVIRPCIQAHSSKCLTVLLLPLCVSHRAAVMTSRLRRGQGGWGAGRGTGSGGPLPLCHMGRYRNKWRPQSSGSGRGWEAPPSSRHGCRTCIQSPTISFSLYHFLLIPCYRFPVSICLFQFITPFLPLFIIMPLPHRCSDWLVGGEDHRISSVCCLFYFSLFVHVMKSVFSFVRPCIKQFFFLFFNRANWKETNCLWVLKWYGVFKYQN